IGAQPLELVAREPLEERLDPGRSDDRIEQLVRPERLERVARPEPPVSARGLARRELGRLGVADERGEPADVEARRGEVGGGRGGGGSRSRRSGRVGGFDGRRSSTGSTKPRPTRSAHTRFTNARANQGFSAPVIQRASACRRFGLSEKSVPSRAPGAAPAYAF